MINHRLSTPEAAARLGVKPETLYAYVSRGLLNPERTSRGSLFDAHEVAQLARSGRKPPRGARSAGTPADQADADPVFLTGLTLIETGHLYYRGEDAVELSRSRTFEETAMWLWTGRWDEDRADWLVPDATVTPLRRALAALPQGAALLERFTLAVVTASHCDDLRHDLNPAGVPVTGRGLVAVLAAALAGGLPANRSTASAAPTSAAKGKSPASISRRVWRGLTDRPMTGNSLGALEAALVLAADHELAPSTLAARVAASFRADPYAVVLTGLGPASGSWQPGSTGAPTEVESLLVEASSVGPERAIGDRLRRTGQIPHGFGMPLYPEGDPRGRELLGRLEEVGDPDRWEVVRQVVEVGAERGFPPPNFDLSLGALAFCADMRPGSGQAIFTLGKVVGWLAHAMEEYMSPTRWRSRADYVGVRPGAG